MTNTLCEYMGVSPVLPVLAASTMGNMTTGIAKDRAFARMYGVVAPKAMPNSSYGLFFSRDVLAMAFIFSLPPIIAPRIKAAVDDGTIPLTEKQASLVTRLSTPVISQLFTTPLHLLGLAIYNATDAPFSAHLKTLKETYPSTVALHMLRIIPASPSAASSSPAAPTPPKVNGPRTPPPRNRHTHTRQDTPPGRARAPRI